MRTDLKHLDCLLELDLGFELLGVGLST